MDYMLSLATGTIHRKNCFRLARQKDGFPLENVFPIGTVVNLGSITKTFQRAGFIRKYDSATIPITTVTATYERTSIVRKHCSACISKRIEVVPMGMRKCYGPLHPEGKLLSTKEFHKHKHHLKRYCRDCCGVISGRKGQLHGFIPKSQVIDYVDGLIEAHGILKTAELIGLTPTGFRYLRFKAKNVTKATAKNILTEYYSLSRAA